MQQKCVEALTEVWLLLHGHAKHNRNAASSALEIHKILLSSACSPGRRRRRRLVRHALLLEYNFTAASVRAW